MLQFCVVAPVAAPGLRSGSGSLSRAGVADRGRGMSSSCRFAAFVVLTMLLVAACGSGSRDSQTFAVVVSVQEPEPQVPTSVGLGEWNGDIISLPREFLTRFTTPAVHQRVAAATASKTGQDLDRVRDGFSISQRSGNFLTVSSTGRGNAQVSQDAANVLADLIRSDPLARRFHEVSRANVIVTVSPA